MRTVDELTAARATPKKAWWRGLGAQVALAMLLGIVVGLCFPGFGKDMKILGELFLSLVKAGVAPLVFFTIVLGLTSAGDLKKASRIGLLALVYFELVSTLALVLGLTAGTVLKVGSGVGDIHSDAKPPSATGGHSFAQFLTDMTPSNFVGAFTSGQLLQVLVLAIIFGVGIMGLPEPTRVKIVGGMETVSHAFFGFINVVMKLAPIGAFGALAYAVASSGTKMLIALSQLVLEFWLVIALFFFVVFGVILRASGVNIISLLRYLRVELGLTLSTASSEAALPGILDKLPRLGVSRQVTGLVVPTGYAFNLDGTSIYMTMCTLFLANIYHVHMGLGRLVTLLLIMLLTSKGAATVSGGTFVVFAATVTATGYIPVEGLPILFGVYRFMSMATATTNTFGNVVAAIVIGRVTKDIDLATTRAALADPTHVPTETAAPIRA